MMYRYLRTLAFFSGISGIAYEVLFVRLISSYVGNIFYVSAALLAVFFLGIALGSLIAGRFTGWLKQIEIGIGFYAILLALVFDRLGLSVTQWVAGLPGPDLLTLPLFVFAILALPATAIGFSLPLFAAFVQHYRPGASRFSGTYAVYNIGAALSVIVIEYLLVRNLGISTSIYLVGSVNLVIGLLLFLVEAPPASPGDRIPDLRHELNPEGRQILLVLLLISIVSGVSQLNLFNLSYYLIGPHNENFALLVSTTLFSIAIAAMLTKLVPIRFEHGLILISILALLPFLDLPGHIDRYTETFWVLDDSTIGIILAKLSIIAVLALPVSIAFGSTVPTAIDNLGLRYTCLVLAVSAVGNAFGYLFYLFFAYAHWLHMQIVAGCAFAAVGAYLVLTRCRSPMLAGILLLSITVLAHFGQQSWPGDFYASSFADKYSSEIKESITAAARIESVRRYGNESTLVTRLNGDIEIHINGYRSLTFDKGRQTVLREAMAGAVAGFFTDRHEEALVFGLGSGITAGAAADFFSRVTVAEINPTMLETAARFHIENNNLLDKPHVEIQVQDGLLTLLENTRKYDAIINTVPSPRYFAANKLWTLEVFEATRERLEKGGVFVGWIDSRLGESGVVILENSLRQVFDHCLYVYLTAGYFAFVCGREELEFKSDNSHGRFPVVEQFLQGRQWREGVPVFFRTLLFAGSNRIPAGTGVNTIDRPLLEFIHRGEGNTDYPFGSFTRLLGRDPFDDSIKTHLCDALKLVEPVNSQQVSKWCR